MCLRSKHGELGKRSLLSEGEASKRSLRAKSLAARVGSVCWDFWWAFEARGRKELRLISSDFGRVQWFGRWGRRSSDPDWLSTEVDTEEPQLVAVQQAGAVTERECL